jgi:hypothetical protein
MVTVSIGVEGVVCEEHKGRVNIYNTLYCILQGSGVSPPWFLTLRGLENNRALLHTLASAHIAVIAFLSSSWHLKKRGKASKKMEERTMGRASLAVLYYRRLEMSHRRSLGVSTPRVRVHPLPSKIPTTAGTTSAGHVDKTVFGNVPTCGWPAKVMWPTIHTLAWLILCFVPHHFLMSHFL